MKRFFQGPPRSVDAVSTTRRAGPGIALGGVHLRRSRALADAAGRLRSGLALDGGAAAPGLLLTLVDPDDATPPRMRGAWIVRLPAPSIARWFQRTPAAAARQLEETGDAWAAPLAAYLHRWTLDELAALGSSFEKALIGEHLLCLLAMAMAPVPADERPAPPAEPADGGPDPRPGRGPQFNTR